jgi:hypothetical protein
MTTLLRSGASLALSGCLFLGCGGSSDTPSGSSGSGAYTLDNVCDQIAPKLCDLRKPCCTASGTGFDQTGCEANMKSQCALDVAAAKAGDETFDASQIDACLAKLPDIFAKCTLTATDLQTIPIELRICNSFVGKKGEGAACTRNSECAQSADANTFVSCSDQTKTCTKLTIAKLGDGCDAAKGTLCDVGLYCNAPALATAGTCKTATSAGQSCARPAIGNPECGIGSYCDATSTTCMAGKAAREACTLPGQCASAKCDNGTCSVGTPFVKAAECGK